MFKAIIFDMDGVIVDSEPVYSEITRAIIEEYGKWISIEETKKYVGVSSSAVWAALKEEYGIGASVEELLEKQSQYLDQSIREKNQAENVPI